MSYEGYYQAICQNGHYQCIPENYGGPHSPCMICKSDWAWLNPVDQTNYLDWGMIPDQQLNTLLVQPEKWETCNLGHYHLISPAIYRVPTPEETQDMRHYVKKINEKYVEIPIPKKG
jgi:hypothetical protein